MFETKIAWANVIKVIALLVWVNSEEECLLINEVHENDSVVQTDLLVKKPKQKYIPWYHVHASSFKAYKIGLKNWNFIMWTCVVPDKLLSWCLGENCGLPVAFYTATVYI
jgi:hypothetical protein